MESKNAVILSLVAGIIFLVISAVIFLISILTFIGGVIENESPPFFLGAIAFVIAVVFLVFAILSIMVSKWMKNPDTTKRGAIVALVIGALTLSNFIGILLIVAGILALVDSDKKN